MTTLPKYLEDVSRRLRDTSASISRDFATHKPSSGDQREECVVEFLRHHLPKRFGVTRGIVLSHGGMFSNQADVLIVDHLNNAPLYSGTRNELWPAEAVYAMIEVKTELSPRDLSDVVAKSRRFKALNRNFCVTGRGQPTKESLFCIWAYKAPSLDVIRENVNNSLSGIPRSEQPDLWVVLDHVVVTSGTYLELSKLGAPGSLFRREIEAQGCDIAALPTCEILDGEHALLAWYVWIDSWLRQAGDRFCDPISYLSGMDGTAPVDT